jgi:hypothetical protein
VAAGRGLSPDVLAANQLAWELQAACLKVNYPLEWAVGVFHSPSGSETVVMPNDGSGYVPREVYLPRSVRLLVADPVVKEDRAFRDYWFGWADPARILVTYAKLRADMDWRLVAAASTSTVRAFEEKRVEHGQPCAPQRSPLLQHDSKWQPPGLDAMHVHRLQLEYPALYERLGSVTDPHLQTRLIAPLGQELVAELKSSVNADCPQELREVWATLMNAGQQPSPTRWARYHEVLRAEVLLSPQLDRPGATSGLQPEDLPAEQQALYRRGWLVARVMEHVGGWMWRPLPLADMVYEAAALRPRSNIARWLDPRLREIEQDQL